MRTRTRHMIEPDAPEAPFPFDFESAYRVDDYRGVGFRAYGYESEPDEDTEWSGLENPTGKILTHMIGDDRPFAFEPDELIRVDEPVCSCGQLGCGWHGGAE